MRISALLDLYERNFRLLQRLVPELDFPFDDAISCSSGDLPLRLWVTERGVDPPGLAVASVQRDSFVQPQPEIIFDFRPQPNCIL